MEPLAGLQLAGAAGNHLAPGTLQKQHLVFDHVHHGFAGGQQVQLVQAVLPKGRGDVGFVAQQGIIIGKAARPQLHPGKVVQLVQMLAALFGRIAQGAVAAQVQPQGQKITAEDHVQSAAVLTLGVGVLQLNFSVRKIAAKQGGLTGHNAVGAAAVAVGGGRVVGHTAAHLLHGFVQRAGGAVEHHQHRGGAEGPAVGRADVGGRAGQPGAGTAVHPAHGGNVVVIKKALDQVALGQKVAPLFLAPLGVLVQRGHQLLLQLLHFGNPVPVEHTPHQHQQRRRVGAQGSFGAFGQGFQHCVRRHGAQKNSGVLLNHPKKGVVVLAAPVGIQGVQQHIVRLKPLAVAVVVQAALFFRQLLKGQGGAVLQHMVAAVAVTVRQALHEGVAAGQLRQQGGGIASAGDGLGHFNRELIGQPHHGQKFLLGRGQRVDHGGGEQGVNVGIFARQRAPLGQRLQVQVNRQDPALRVVQKVLQFLLGEIGPAAVHVDGQVGLIQPKLLGRELVQPVPQANALPLGEDPVPAGDDQVNVARHMHGGAAEKLGHGAAAQQVEVVHKNVAFVRPGQLAVQIVQNQGGPGEV